MRIVTNKIKDFFCHSRISGNPAALVVALLFLFGMVFVPAGYVSASHPCVNEVSDPNDAHPCEQVAGSLPSDNLTDAGDNNGEITSIQGLLSRINALLNTIVPFIVGLAVFVIIWGVFQYVTRAGDEEKRAEAKLFVVWGVVFVFIMVSIWGLVNILVNTFELRKSPVPVGSVFPSSE